MTDWPAVVRQLMVEQRVSERALAIRSGVYRSTLRKFLHGEANLKMHQFEWMLHALGAKMKITPAPPKPALRLKLIKIRLPRDT